MPADAQALAAARLARYRNGLNERTPEMPMTAERAYDWDPAVIRQLTERYRRGGPLPRAFYLSPAVFNADLDRIWRRYWLYAGHTAQIPQAGDWITWQVGDDTILIVRGGDGEVRAFHNTCRHRGARICNGEHGSSRLLVCPYHAWTYDLDGRLRTETRSRFGVERSELGLRPVALRILAGVMMVALGPGPVSFDQAADEIAGPMAHQGLEEAKVAKSIRYRVKANWKLIFENNRECYHCPTAHPEYVKGTLDTMRLDPATAAEADRQTARASARFEAMGLGPAIAASDMTGKFWRVTRAPLREGFSTETLDGAPAAPLMGTFRLRNEWSMGTLRTTVFPNFWQHANDDHAVATRVTPIDARTTDVDVLWLVHKDAIEGRDYTLERLLPFWQRTSEQDWTICEANQAGIASPAYVPGPYARSEEANVQHFIDWYLAALDLPRPAPAKPKLRSIGYKDRPGE